MCYWHRNLNPICSTVLHPSQMFLVSIQNMKKFLSKSTLLKSDPSQSALAICEMWNVDQTRILTHDGVTYFNQETIVCHLMRILIDTMKSNVESIITNKCTTCTMHIILLYKVIMHCDISLFIPQQSLLPWHLTMHQLGPKLWHHCDVIQYKANFQRQLWFTESN